MEVQYTLEEEFMEYEGRLKTVIDSCTADFEIDLGFGLTTIKRLKLWGIVQLKDKAKQRAAIALIKKSIGKSLVSIHFQEEPIPHHEPYFVTISFESKRNNNAQDTKLITVFLNELLLLNKLVSEYMH